MAVAAPLPAGGWESMRGLELADIALGAAAIILMFALLLVSMPGVAMNRRASRPAQAARTSRKEITASIAPAASRRSLRSAAPRRGRAIWRTWKS